MRKIFVTGIGTGVGKTVVSAILTEALRADYWKPIQAGELENTDSMKVRNWVTNPSTVVHKETYRLTNPFSPHIAAAMDGKQIDLKEIVIPTSTNQVLIIEGAGGLMVPLNDKELMLDVIKQLQAEVVLVSQNYLGSINHTLLSAEILKQKRVNVIGVIFNGEEVKSTEQYILNYSKLKNLGRINQEKAISTMIIKKYAQYFKGT